jgi:hypothetical protein
LKRTASRAGADHVVEGAGRPAGRERPPFVVVLGVHRSGTSLCAHVVNALGVGMSDDPLPRPSNPKGHWERWEIVGFHDRILDLFNRGYLTPLHDLLLPAEWWLDPRVREIKREMTAFLDRKMVSGVPFGFKDPRTARLLPLWRQIFSEVDADVKIIICLRNPVQVARSLQQRDGLPADLGEYRWFTYMAELCESFGKEDVCAIEYEAWFDSTADNATKLVRFLGLEKSQAEIIAAVSEVIDRELRHDDPALPQSGQPVVRSLYEALRRLDVDPAAGGEIRQIVNQFAAFRALTQGVAREFEQLSAFAGFLAEGAHDDDNPPIVSWRDPRIEGAWNRMVNAAHRTASVEQQLKTALRQRAELDAALARTQQAAALSNRAAQTAQQELARSRQGFSKSTTEENAKPAAVPSIRTALPLGAKLSPIAAEELIDVVIAQGDPEFIDRTIQLRGDEAEFSRLLAAKLFEAGLLSEARRAAAKAAPASASERQHRFASTLPDTPIFFRHEPVEQHDQELVLWYRPDPARQGAAAGNRVRAYLRWFDHNGRILVWESEPVIFDLAEPRYWQPVVVRVPLSGRQKSWLRFEIVAAGPAQTVLLGTGFLFGAGRVDTQPSISRDVLACTDAGRQAAWPGQAAASDVGQASTAGVVDRSTQFGGPVVIGSDALADTEILCFVDWGCFGKRLATARIPSGALSGSHQLLLPTRGPGGRVFGLSRASGVVPIVTQTLNEAGWDKSATAD